MELILPKSVEKRLYDYTMAVEGEIAGMGKVRVEGNRVIVEEVMVYEQEVSAATADLSTQALAKFQTELVRRGESPKNWRLWWHSHSDMDAFFSKRDTDTMDANAEGDWIVSLVVNKRRERKARLDVYAPFHIFLDDVEVSVEGDAAYEVPEDIAAEVALKVKEKRMVGYGTGYGTGQGTGYTPHEYHASHEQNGDISQHRYCPFFTIGTRVCYHPYGKQAGQRTDCTSKAFKKRYGASPFIEAEGLDELRANVAILEQQLNERNDYGSTEVEQLTNDLVDALYELGSAEPDAAIATAIREKAEKIERLTYSLEYQV